MKKVERVEYSDIIPIALPSKPGRTGDTKLFKIVEDTAKQRSLVKQKSSQDERDGSVQVRLTQTVRFPVCTLVL